MTTKLDIRVARFQQLQSGSIDGDIWFRIGDADFPAADWYDYPLTLLSWWLEHVSGLLGRSQRNACLDFMDGPYDVRLTRLGAPPRAAYECRRYDDVWHRGELSLVELRWEIVRAARDAIAQCKQQGISDTDLVKLEAMIGPARSG